MFHDFIKHKDNKISPNGDGKKFKKKECRQSVTIQDLTHNILLQSLTGTAKHKCGVAARNLVFNSCSVSFRFSCS